MLGRLFGPWPGALLIRLRLGLLSPGVPGFLSLGSPVDEATFFFGLSNFERSILATVKVGPLSFAYLVWRTFLSPASPSLGPEASSETEIFSAEPSIGTIASLLSFGAASLVTSAF